MPNFFDKKAFPVEPEDVVEPQHQEINDAEMTAVAEQQVVEIQEMDEAERRVIKAGYYRDILNEPLFGDDEEPEAYDVEEEIRAFAKERLRVYLGMTADSRPKMSTKEVVAKIPFTEKQVQVLIGWADSLISRPKLLGAMTPPARGRPQEPQEPQAAKAADVQAPVAPIIQRGEPPRRGRGRPPGTGKNQRAAAARAQGSQSQQPQAPVVAQKVHTGDAQIDPETGKPFIMMDSFDAQGRPIQKKHFVEEQAAPQGVQPKPWPAGHSPLENEGGVQSFVSNGGAQPLSGPLQRAIQHFSR